MTRPPPRRCGKQARMKYTIPNGPAPKASARSPSVRSSKDSPVRAAVASLTRTVHSAEPVDDRLNCALHRRRISDVALQSKRGAPKLLYVSGVRTRHGGGYRCQPAEARIGRHGRSVAGRSARGRAANADAGDRGRGRGVPRRPCRLVDQQGRRRLVRNDMRPSAGSEPGSALSRFWPDRSCATAPMSLPTGRSGSADASGRKECWRSRMAFARAPSSWREPRTHHRRRSARLLAGPA